MKKVFITTVIVVLGLSNVNAQEIKLGVKAGLNFSSITGDNASDFGITTDFNFGFMAEIPISEKFSFQPELLYSGQGAEISLTYLNIPLMGKYYVTKGLSLEAGPQIGFLLSAENEDTDVKDSFKTVDLGLNLGIGYKLDNGLNFGARYNFGVSDINDVDNLSDKNRNAVLQLSVGYFFF